MKTLKGHVLESLLHDSGSLLFLSFIDIIITMTASFAIPIDYHYSMNINNAVYYYYY